MTVPRDIFFISQPDMRTGPVSSPNKSHWQHASAWHIIVLPLALLFLGSLIRFFAFRYSQPDIAPSRYFDALCWWDCHWYVLLAERGYDSFPSPTGQDAVNWAFFPFYPMLVGLVAKLVPLPTVVVGSIVSLVTAYVAVIAAWPLLGKNLKAYILYAAYILAGPFSFYFTTFFTEVMFLLLTTLVFRSLNRSNYLRASIAAALLSGTRIVGVFASIAVGVQALSDYRTKHGTWSGVIRGLLGQPNLVLAIFIAPAGCFAYIAYLHFTLGDGFAFSHVQRAWGRELANPIVYLWKGLAGEVDGAYGQILALTTIGGVALSVILGLQRQWAAMTFCLICIFIPLTAGLGSMLRFVSALAPLAILAALLLASRTWIFAISFLAILVGSWFVTLAWLEGANVLV